MKHWYDDPPTFAEGDDPIVVGRPAFVASFYRDAGLVDQAQSLFDAWQALLPSKMTLYYSHEDTKRFMKATPKALAKIRAEFSAKHLRKDDDTYACYLIKSAPADGPVDECHAYNLEMYAADDENGYAYVTFPRDHVDTTGAEAVSQWFNTWSSQFDVTHASAGLGFEVAWFGEQARCAGPAMLAVGLRFHGVRLWQRDQARMRERGAATLDTVGWLTYLDASSLRELGTAAIEQIDRRVVRRKLGTGLVLQAGPEPDPCDSNERGDAYALLKSVNDAIKPIRSKWVVDSRLGCSRQPRERNQLVLEDGRMNISGWPFTISVNGNIEQGGTATVSVDSAVAITDERYNLQRYVVESFVGLAAIGGLGGDRIEPKRSSAALKTPVPFMPGVKRTTWHLDAIAIDPRGLVVLFNALAFLGKQIVHVGVQAPGTTLSVPISVDELPPVWPHVPFHEDDDRTDPQVELAIEFGSVPSESDAQLALQALQQWLDCGSIHGYRDWSESPEKSFLRPTEHPAFRLDDAELTGIIEDSGVLEGCYGILTNVLIRLNNTMPIVAVELL